MKRNTDIDPTIAELIGGALTLIALFFVLFFLLAI